MILDTQTYISIAFLHTGAFAYFLFDYALQRPKTKLAVKDCFLWLLYPVTYEFYIFGLAQFRPWYPYPFMNPNLAGSVQAVVVNQLVLFMIALTVAFGVRWVHNILQERYSIDDAKSQAKDGINQNLIS